MTDFLQPGNDGSLPDGFAVWRRGVTNTVRPEPLEAPPRGREFRINATVRRKLAKDEASPDYAAIYQRCLAILRNRGAEFLLNARKTDSVAAGAGRELVNGSDDRNPIHTWVEWHAWWASDVSDKYPDAGEHVVACASITLGLVYPKSGAPKPEGQRPPEPAQLRKPGGAMADPLALQQHPERIDESYVEFDFDDPSAPTADITISYGERVPSTVEINFEPFVRRAESLAVFYAGTLSPDVPIVIARREWFSITDANFVVVTLYFRNSRKTDSVAAMGCESS
ncbi:MAG: hypothetical protein ACKV2U_33270 [Bryobacteraceae bacterium]